MHLAAKSAAVDRGRDRVDHRAHPPVARRRDTGAVSRRLDPCARLLEQLAPGAALLRLSHGIPSAARCVASGGRVRFTDSTAPECSRAPIPRRPDCPSRIRHIPGRRVLKISRQTPGAARPPGNCVRGTGVKLQTTSSGGASARGALRRKAMTLMSRIVDIEPLEAVGRKIDLVQGRLAAVNAVQISHQMLARPACSGSRPPTTRARPRASIRAAARIRRP